MLYSYYSLVIHTYCYPCTGSESSNSLSTVAAVVIVVIVTMVISIILTSIVMLIIIKKCSLKRTQQAPVIQLSTVNNIITADVNMEPPHVKMQSNPAYQVMQKNNSQNDRDNYYY